MQERGEALVRDRLARQRTELANERTLLAYMRTALGFVVVGVPAVWWMEGRVVQALGVVSLIVGAVIMSVGVLRFLAMKAGINREAE